MLRVNLNCYGSYTTDSIFQWDQNHILTLTGDNIDDISAIHFCNKKCDNARVVNVVRGSGEISAPIPNELLEMPYDVIAYVHTIDNNQAKTIQVINIPLIKRVKPDDYEFVENVDIANFERLEKDIQDFIASITKSYDTFTTSIDNRQTNFESEFMDEYNSRVASGYFLNPESATELNNRLATLEQQIIDVDALNDASGSPILLTDSAEGILTDFTAYGKSVQNGEPTPDSPINIKSVADGGYFDGELMTGFYSATGSYVQQSAYVCSKNPIPCNGDDTVKVIYATISSELALIFYDKDMNFISRLYDVNVTEYEEIAPTNAKYVHFYLREPNTVITPTTAKPISVTINGKYALIVKSEGKNLLKSNIDNQTLYGITFANNNDSSIAVKGTSSNEFSITMNNNVKLSKGTYILTGLPFTDGTSRLGVRLGPDASYGYAFDFGNGVEFTLPENRNVSVFIVLKGNVTFDGTVYPMLRPINTDATYEPYKETVTYIPLNEPLRNSLDGTVTDEVSLTEVTRRFAEVVFDGSDDEGWKISATDLYTSAIANVVKKPASQSDNSNALCDRFVCYSPITFNTEKNNGNSCMNVGTNGNVVFFKNDITTVDAWKTWLQANPITVQYELAEPVIEEIDPVEIVTYDNVTHLSASDNAPMWIEYYSNSPVGQRLAKTNEDMKKEHELFESTLGYLTTEKNLLPGRMFAESKTLSGVTVTVHEDNSFTLNGTASQGIQITLAPNVILEDGVEYILNGCPSGGSKDTYCLVTTERSSGSTTPIYDTGDGVKFTGDGESFSTNLLIASGTTLDNLTFKPMLRLASIEDDTYEAYGLNVKNKLKEIDSRTAIVSGYKNTIEVSANDTVVSFDYPNGFKRTNSIVIGASVGYWQNDYESPMKYTSDAVVELTDSNINLYVKGNSFSKYVTTNIVLFKIA